MEATDWNNVFRFTPTGVGRTSTPPVRPAPAPVHPHGRGEDWVRLGCPAPLNGSPPRAWGGLHVAAGLLADRRFTPTGVGRTQGGPCRPRTCAVHPHGRGEDSSLDSARSSRCGSPPRAWGGLDHRVDAVVGDRFTPTGVGRTRAGGPARWPSPVHPHGRGEDPQPRLLTTLRTGSPPRAWGGRLAVLLRGELGRFTPTGVGRTCATAARTTARTVHPHGRGEDLICSSIRPSRSGSPPRAWGGRSARVQSAGWSRFTPTGVGRTSRYMEQQGLDPVHPHGRGEDPERCRWRRAGPRFTPTGVGRTYSATFAMPLMTVHPHGRGEDSSLSVRRLLTFGSPPRAWGGLGPCR